MKLWHKPTGRLIRGHVLDVSKIGFDRALRDYDKNLYSIWNPMKLKGWGCWEIRRKPNLKSKVYMGTHEGVDYYRLEYIETDHVHHVLDAAFLNYDAIRKIKEMDTWGSKDWVSQLEAREEAHRESVREKAKAELKYALKQNRSMARDFYEMVKSGIDPAQVVTSVNWAQKD